MTAELEADIQAAWNEANKALRCTNAEREELTGLIAALRHCATRSSAIGFVTGERELLRMARYLEGRISSSEFPRYKAE